MEISGFPANCGLGIAHYMPTGDDSAWDRKEWNRLPKERCILSITDEDPEIYKAQAAILKKKGWKVLGKHRGMHSDDYWDYIWGSPDFKVVVKKGK
jgi:hypothetical protein